VQEKSQKWVKEVLLKEYDSFEFYTGPSFNTEGALAMMIYEGVPHELVRCEYYKYPARRRRRRSDSRSLVISVTVSQVSGEESCCLRSSVNISNMWCMSVCGELRWRNDGRPPSAPAIYIY
jgi:hypothetical protein